MKKLIRFLSAGLFGLCVLQYSCKLPEIVPAVKPKDIPAAYNNSNDSNTIANIKWNTFFTDTNLVALIDTALKNNQDLLMTMQQIVIAENEVLFRRGALIPAVNGVAGTGVEKVGKYTSQGAGDASAEITPGKIVPENLGDFAIGLQTHWEADIWGKLHNARNAAMAKYLATMEGKNLVVTNLVAEIANSYYELLSLDNQLDIIRETIKIQQNALEIVRIQKQASQVTELAVKQFEAQLFNSQSMEYGVLQNIAITENKINFLLGRFPQPVIRTKASFAAQLPMQFQSGIPSQLLQNRPDIRQAAHELYATGCDVKVAQAEFYPSVGITATLGFQAFKPSYLFNTPQSLAYALLGDLTAPLINKRAIKAEFNMAKAYQVEAMYEYQRAILNGFVEVSTEMSNISNLQKSYALKSKRVETLSQSIDIANDLFKAARANYLEVLMTQKEALEAKLELAETKEQQFNAMINLYKALGGGWR